MTKLTAINGMYPDEYYANQSSVELGGYKVKPGEALEPSRLDAHKNDLDKLKRGLIGLIAVMILFGVPFLVLFVVLLAESNFGCVRLMLFIGLIGFVFIGMFAIITEAYNKFFYKRDIIEIATNSDKKTAWLTRCINWFEHKGKKPKEFSHLSVHQLIQFDLFPRPQEGKYWDNMITNNTANARDLQRTLALHYELLSKNVLPQSGIQARNSDTRAYKPCVGA